MVNCECGSRGVRVSGRVGSIVVLKAVQLMSMVYVTCRWDLLDGAKMQTDNSYLKSESEERRLRDPPSAAFALSSN